MSKLLVCIDGSSYADNLCSSAAWVAKRLKSDVELLHVLRRHSDYEAPADHTGSIGIGARSELLEELLKVDEERGQLDQKKGKIILKHGEKILKAEGVKNVNAIHRRGALVDTIKEFETDVEIIFMGKRGEHANEKSDYLGSNLEKVIRAIHHPLFLVSSIVRPIKRFLIAYDGKDSSRLAIDYIVNKPELFKGLECHLLAVEEHKDDLDLSLSIKKLSNSGLHVVSKSEKNNHADKAIVSYVTENKIDLLVIGAYSHSRIRSLLLGSTTESLIKSCKIPMLLFR